MIATWVMVPKLAVAAGNVTVALVELDPADAVANVTACLAYAVPDVLTSADGELVSNPVVAVNSAKYSVVGAV